MKIFDYLRILLVGIGLLQIIGFATGQKWLKGIGQITVASPLPVVFTEQKGCETFALDFSVEYVDSNNQQGTISITPQIYSRFDGPYNYRNVVGAAISYGAILPEKIWKAVLMYAFIKPGEVGRAFNLETPLRKVTVQLNSRTKGKNKVWRLPLENMMP